LIKLTAHQHLIINLLRIDGTYIWHNEGENFRAWITLPSGKTRGIRVRTVELLVDYGVIKLDEGEYPRHLFRYSLNSEWR